MAVKLPLPFRPLDDEFLRIAMAAALGSQPLVPLVPNTPGVGVYALYYRPAVPPADVLLKLYARACGDGKVPLYVGVTIKANPEGADGSWALKGRLALHQKKLDKAVGMSSSDFLCRALPCDNRWAELVEQYLIQAYRPVWNLVVSGFGSNLRGSGRKDQKASRWEVLHQGLSSSTLSRVDIESDVIRHLGARPRPRPYRFADR